MLYKISAIFFKATKLTYNSQVVCNGCNTNDEGLFGTCLIIK